MNIQSTADLPAHDLDPVLIASHPRSGTHLVIDTIRRQFPSTRNWRWWGLPLDHLYLNVERLSAHSRRFDDALARRIVERPRRALMKTHYVSDFSESWVGEESAPPPPHWADFVSRAKVLYVTRHPLDTLSSYLQFLSAVDHGVEGMGLRDFLESPHWTGQTDRLGWWCDHVEGWLARPRIFHLRYEDVVRKPAATLDRLAGVLNEPWRNREPALPPKNTSITRTRADRLLRLSPSSTAIIADRRRYPPKPWREALSDTDLNWVEQRCGGLVERLGYSLARDPRGKET
jgi:hypothetical protein